MEEQVLQVFFRLAKKYDIAHMRYVPVGCSVACVSAMKYKIGLQFHASDFVGQEVA
jgi:hypothetical protein